MAFRCSLVQISSGHCCIWLKFPAWEMKLIKSEGQWQAEDPIKHTGIFIWGGDAALAYGRVSQSRLNHFFLFTQSQSSCYLLLIIFECLHCILFFFVQEQQGVKIILPDSRGFFPIPPPSILPVSPALSPPTRTPSSESHPVLTSVFPVGAAGGRRRATLCPA